MLFSMNKKKKKKNLINTLTNIKIWGKQLQSAQLIMVRLERLVKDYPKFIIPQDLHEIMKLDGIELRTHAIINSAKVISKLLDDLDYYHKKDDNFGKQLNKCQHEIIDLSTNYRHERYIVFGDEFKNGYSHLGLKKIYKVIHDLIWITKIS